MDYTNIVIWVPVMNGDAFAEVARECINVILPTGEWDRDCGGFARYLAPVVAWPADYREMALDEVWQVVEYLRYLSNNGGGGCPVSTWGEMGLCINGGLVALYLAPFMSLAYERLRGRCEFGPMWLVTHSWGAGTRVFCVGCGKPPRISTTIVGPETSDVPIEELAKLIPTRSATV